MEFTVQSKEKNEILDINGQVEEIVNKSKVKEGFVIVYTPHATCAVIVNENYDPNILPDIIDALADLIPEGKWRHDKIDNNAAAHIKASIIGPSEIIPIKDSKLMLGQWQNIMVADFDGPKQRKVLVQVIKG